MSSHLYVSQNLSISVIDYINIQVPVNSFETQAQPPAERWMKHREEFELWAFHEQEIKADWLLSQLRILNYLNTSLWLGPLIELICTQSGLHPPNGLLHQHKHKVMHGISQNLISPSAFLLILEQRSS